MINNTIISHTNRKKSSAIFAESIKVIPGGVNSPVRAFHNFGIDPLIAERGKGDLLTDADGNHYIDYCCSWGALIHGHAPKEVIEAAKEQMDLGSTFGIATEVEKDLATHIVSRIPCLDQIRFVSSGTEATMSAIRLARGYTGRDLILKFNGNYHGHSDAFLISAGSGATNLKEPSTPGVPKQVIANTASLPFNDIETVRSFIRTHKLAAVIIEPACGNMGVVPADPAFLRMLRKETEKQEALLIIDEIITGFRLPNLYDIEPDLICYGKIIGGGFPAAAFGGKKEIMEHLAPTGPVYQAGTLSGCPVAMRAGLTTLEMTTRPHFYEELNQKADLLTSQIPMSQNSCLQQVGSMFTLFFGVPSVTCQEDLVDLDRDEFRRFFLYLFNRGIYIPPSPFEAWFISSAHTEEHLNYTAEVIASYFRT